LVSPIDAATKTALMQALVKAAQEVAGKEALDVSNTEQLRDICLAMARLFGWSETPKTEVRDTQRPVILIEEMRMRMIACRQARQAKEAHAQLVDANSNEV